MRRRRGRRRSTGSRFSVGRVVVRNVSPRLVVHELAQQLDGGLRAVGLLLRHVQIIHHDHHALADGRPVEPLAPLVQLGVDLAAGTFSTSTRTHRSTTYLLSECSYIRADEEQWIP